MTLNDNVETAPKVDINSLPTFIICPGCEELHYLTLNKQSNGLWACGYVTYEGDAIGGLAFNNSETIDEAAYRMLLALERFKRRNGGGQWLDVKV